MRMSHNKIFIALFFFVVFLVTSCTPKPAWVTRMLDKPVCLAPCWENITPGITTWDELSQMLNHGSNVFDVTRIAVGEPGGPVISWCDGGSPCGSGGYINALSSFDNKMIVREIVLRPGINLYLKDFLPLYGLPEKVIFSDAFSDLGNVVVGLLYPKLGLVLEFYSKNLGVLNNPEVDFQKDMNVESVIYTTPGLDYYYLHNLVKPLEQSEQFEWKGYTHYP
jgi:hypothetical protein